MAAGVIAGALVVGLVGAVLLLGTVGVGDAMSPDNKDFAILRPTWLAVSLVAITCRT